jgi:alkylation response protein AidB-like acyl-CoA dehydrogenase
VIATAQTELREAVREAAAGVAERHPREEWLRLAREGRHLEAMWSDLATAGLLGLGVPESMGGMGGGVSELVLLMDVLASAGVPTLHQLLTGLVHVALVRNGTALQIDRYVRPSVAGEHRLGLAVTEPDAGTNSFAIKTTARRAGDRWVVNGQKTFISGADESAHLFTVARSAEHSEPGGRAALSVLMVPLKARGIQLQPLDIEIIQPDRQFTVFMDDVEVDDDALVGRDGAGASVMFDALNTERLLVATMAMGLGEYALGKAVAYARERSPFGRPIGAYQGVQHRLARAKAHLEAARSVIYGAAEAFDRGDSVGPACSMAKLLASEAGVEACDAAIQTHGGYAFDAGYDVSTIWPLVRLFCIAPVNNEMVLNSIGQHLLGLPKSY